MVPGTILPQPCPVCCPQPRAWLDGLMAIVSTLAVPVALFTFWLGYRQRERERTLSYYHKVVVDVVIDDVFSFFDKQIRSLTESGTAAREGLAAGRLTMPRPIKQALTGFSTALFSLQDQIAERTVVFDVETTELVKRAFERIQDQATGWFNDLYQHKRRGIEELNNILREGQRSIIKQLYAGQFRNF